MFYNDLNSHGKELDRDLLRAENDFSFEKTLSLNNLNFQYPGADRKAVNNLNLEIKAKTSIGIVGISGSGKSTLVDIILGLLPLDSGAIYVDGVELKARNVCDWQRDIGYVSQVIFLADSSIRENIAFGIPEGEIDGEAGIRAARMSNLHDFIESDLPDKYETFVGEGGVRLSGGQRQRIGIARALYHNPDVLILDEATSALDTPTEKSIIEEVNKLSDSKTIVMIAHRLSTIKECDNIIIMEYGEIVDSGSYSNLSEKKHRSFKIFAMKEKVNK